MPRSISTLQSSNHLVDQPRLAIWQSPCRSPFATQKAFSHVHLTSTSPLEVLVSLLSEQVPPMTPAIEGNSNALDNNPAAFQNCRPLPFAEAPTHDLDTAAHKQTHLYRGACLRKGLAKHIFVTDCVQAEEAAKEHTTDTTWVTRSGPHTSTANGPLAYRRVLKAGLARDRWDADGKSPEQGMAKGGRFLASDLGKVSTPCSSNRREGALSEAAQDSVKKTEPGARRHGGGAAWLGRLWARNAHHAEGDHQEQHGSELLWPGRPCEAEDQRDRQAGGEPWHGSQEHAPCQSEEWQLAGQSGADQQSLWPAVRVVAATSSLRGKG